MWKSPAGGHPRAPPGSIQGSVESTQWVDFASEMALKRSDLAHGNGDTTTKDFFVQHWSLFIVFFKVFFFIVFFFLDLTTSLNRIVHGDEKHVNESSSLLDFRPFRRQNRKRRNLRRSQFATFPVLALEIMEIDEDRSLVDVLFIIRKNPIQRSGKIQKNIKKQKNNRMDDNKCHVVQ